MVKFSSLLEQENKGKNRSRNTFSDLNIVKHKGSSMDREPLTVATLLISFRGLSPALAYPNLV